jgi:16S rRNA (guanine1207-N2)-methyltransferase
MEKFTVKWHYHGFDYKFHTLDSLFSYKQVDIGTQQMIKHIELPSDSKVLDLGCGYGVVGIWAAHTIGSQNVVMSDVNVAALEMAAENVTVNNLEKIRMVQSDGFHNIHDTDFTLILSNPPYHTNFSVAKSFIEGSYKHLQMGGWLVMVTKRFDWYKNKIHSVFGGLKWIESSGYYVFLAQKRFVPKNGRKKKGLSKKLQRKHQKHPLNDIVR